ncbi:hypothetical protein HK405_014407 [Cladochytrium tenue]|nr:hypothetical protein HK405_014407 [Cladochytrium tenue]
MDALRRLSARAMTSGPSATATAGPTDADIAELRRQIEAIKAQLFAGRAIAAGLPGAHLDEGQQANELARLDSALAARRAQLEQFRSLPIIRKLTGRESEAAAATGVGDGMATALGTDSTRVKMEDVVATVAVPKVKVEDEDDGAAPAGGSGVGDAMDVV